MFSRNHLKRLCRMKCSLDMMRFQRNKVLIFSVDEEEIVEEEPVVIEDNEANIEKEKNNENNKASSDGEGENNDIEFEQLEQVI